MSYAVHVSPFSSPPTLVANKADHHNPPGRRIVPRDLRGQGQGLFPLLRSHLEPEEGWKHCRYHFPEGERC